MKNSFTNVAAKETNDNWHELIKRSSEIYSRESDIRSDFGRDYTRILHCLAYRRLKHKTQVFFNTSNDHVCTRMEHVNHVESVSFSIANYLGLNTELTKAIATGHDLGHAPFGHHGEKVLKELASIYIKDNFWHEKNGLHFVDDIELLEDNNQLYRNLDLTYAVRDGIIAHCGEVNESTIFPRSEAINLNDYKNTNQYEPYTWEGCIVKIADKIAYLGRDIEDAICMNLIKVDALRQLKRISQRYNLSLNTTTIMHSLIIDLCTNSSPEHGLQFSQENYQLLCDIKDFNYKYIYENLKFNPFKRYAELIIKEIFHALFNAYYGKRTINEIKMMRSTYPELFGGFYAWVIRYCALDSTVHPEECTEVKNYKNVKTYAMLETKEIYAQAIIDYIAGMTDKYAIRIFQELVKF